MKTNIKTLVGIFIILYPIVLQAQYETNYPFDSAWLTSFDGPVFNIVDFGAIPNDSINDNKYFLQAADSIEKYNGGKLIIPAGVYIVGEQTINTIQGDEIGYYEEKEILEIHDVSNIIIEGEPGTVLKMDSNIRYGSFDPVSGAIYNPPAGGFTDPDYAVDAGTIICMRGCTNVSISNIECDGNTDNLIIGGYWGDVGIQREATGVAFYECSNVLARDIYTHHNGLDGFYISWYGLNEEDEPTPHILENVVSEYNGRQGLSWVGGIGVTAYNCKFNHTGKAGIYSQPGAGVDIEAEESVCRGGKFIECEFTNNAGPGMVTDSGDGGFSTFENCTFWGTTNYPIWVNKPSVKFINCNIYGTFLVASGNNNPDLATQFNNCNFEDLIHYDYGVYINPEYPFLMHLWEPGKNVSFTNCQFTANHCKSIKVVMGDFFFDNCTFTHRATDLDENEPICVLETSTITNSVFVDDFPQGFNKIYWIQTYKTNVGDCVYLNGENVKWEDAKTNYNWILPGKYPRVKNIEITSPSLNSSILPGNSIDITWTDQYAKFVGLELYNNCSFHSNIIEQTENDGLYQWTVPSNIVSSGAYSIKIFDLDYPYNFDYSDSLTIILSSDEITYNTKKTLSFYPNPTARNLYFDIEDNYEIYNSLGQKVLVLNKTKTADVAKFTAGIYFIVNSKGKTFKFIKW